MCPISAPHASSSTEPILRRRLLSKNPSASPIHFTPQSIHSNFKKIGRFFSIVSLFHARNAESPRVTVAAREKHYGITRTDQRQSGQRPVLYRAPLRGRQGSRWAKCNPPRTHRPPPRHPRR